MKILIDMQGAQSTGSRNRGIGRYTQSLVRSLLLNSRDSDDVILMFSSAFAACIPDVLSELNVDLAPHQVCVWHCNAMVSATEGATAEREAAELSREVFIATIAPDVVVITSIFEGLGDDVVTSVGKFSAEIPTAVVLYDLIPYIHRSIYLADPRVEAWYERKLQELRKADVLLAISEATRQDGLNYLSFPEDEIVNISSAVEGFAQRTVEASEAASLRAKYGITTDYVLYTGGIDHRKNIEGLVEAFSTLPKALLNETQLVIVCSVQNVVRERLLALASSYGLASNAVVLTGFVPEGDLVRLYTMCKLFVFPSLYEGFGLPVLEAMNCGAVVVGSNTSSIPEVIEFDQALFDPSDRTSIASKLVIGLTDEEFRRSFREHAALQVRKFSWEESGRRSLAALRRVVETRTSVTPSAKTGVARRSRLAYVSPLPPMKSGIADFSAELLPDFARLYEVDLVVDQPTIDFPWANGAARVVATDWFRSHASEYDRVLYHFGNSEFHKHMFDLLVDIPGVVVLHDFFLSGIHHYMQAYGLRENSLINEMYASHAYPGVRATQSTTVDDLIRDYPCNFTVLANAVGLITHSEFSRSLGSQYFGDSTPPVWDVVPLVRMLPPLSNRAVARRKLGLSDSDLLICSFGIVASTKLNDRILKAWDQVQSKSGRITNLVFVGGSSGSYGSQLESDLKRKRSGGKASITGWVDQEAYRDYLLAADIAVQLRGLSRGETSAAVLDCMAAGLPTIVNANGSMAELPEDAVLRLPDQFTDDQLVDALKKLLDDADLRSELGQRARHWIRDHHSPRQVSAKYFSAIEEAYASPHNLRHQFGRAVAEQTSGLTNRGLVSLAAATARNFRPKGWQRQVLIQMPEEGDTVRRQVLTEALQPSFAGFRVEPFVVKANGEIHYARSATLSLLGLDRDLLTDEAIDLFAEDIIFADVGDASAQNAIKANAVITPGLQVLPWEDASGFLSTLEQSQHENRHRRP